MAVNFIDGETRVPGKCYHLSQSWHVGKRTMKFLLVKDTDCMGKCKSKSHTITLNKMRITWKNRKYHTMYFLWWIFCFISSHLSRHLLDICNLLDIERKLDLYKAMFYHNIPTYRDTNYVTEESLKIELMAGGLNWSQQQFAMEKMEPNSLGEVSLKQE